MLTFSFVNCGQLLPHVEACLVRLCLLYVRDSALEGMHTFACRACDLQTTTGKDVNAVVRTGRIFCCAVHLCIQIQCVM